VVAPVVVTPPLIDIEHIVEPLPAPGVWRVEMAQRRRVYIALDDETPKQIAKKFGIDLKQVLRNNVRLHPGLVRSSKLYVRTKMVLPLLAGDAEAAAATAFFIDRIAALEHEVAAQAKAGEELQARLHAATEAATEEAAYQDEELGTMHAFSGQQCDAIDRLKTLAKECNACPADIRHAARLVATAAEVNQTAAANGLTNVLVLGSISRTKDENADGDDHGDTRSESEAVVANGAKVLQEQATFTECVGLNSNPFEGKPMQPSSNHVSSQQQQQPPPPPPQQQQHHGVRSNAEEVRGASTDVPSFGSPTSLAAFACSCGKTFDQPMPLRKHKLNCKNRIAVLPSSTHGHISDGQWVFGSDGDVAGADAAMDTDSDLEEELYEDDDYPCAHPTPPHVAACDSVTSLPLVSGAVVSNSGSDIGAYKCPGCLQNFLREPGLQGHKGSCLLYRAHVVEHKRMSSTNSNSNVTTAGDKVKVMGDAPKSCEQSDLCSHGTNHRGRCNMKASTHGADDLCPEWTEGNHPTPIVTRARMDQPSPVTPGIAVKHTDPTHGQQQLPQSSELSRNVDQSNCMYHGCTAREFTAHGDVHAMVAGRSIFRCYKYVDVNQINADQLVFGSCNSGAT
jgi:hypothetical protein